MHRRRALRWLGGMPWAVATVAVAQPAPVRRVCFLLNTPPTTPASARAKRAFDDQLERHGFVEGRNVAAERRYTEGNPERIDALADDLLRRDCEVVVATAGDRAVRALMDRTSRIPIVMVGASDPVRDGFVASLARPGGNVTGVASSSLDLLPKQIELLAAAAPTVRRVVQITGLGHFAGSEAQRAEIARRLHEAAQAHGLSVARVDLREPADFAAAGATILRERPDALLVNPNSTNFVLREHIAAFALQHRLPAIGATREYAEAGFLLSYGNNLAWLFRRTADYVARILKGARPGELAVEQTPFELVVNAKTAGALRLELPAAIQARADEVLR